MVVFKRRKTEPPANGHDAAHAVRSRARRMGSNPTVCEQARRPGFLFDPQTDGATDMDPNTLKTIYEAQLEAQLMEDTSRRRSTSTWTAGRRGACILLPPGTECSAIAFTVTGCSPSARWHPAR